MAKPTAHTDLLLALDREIGQQEFQSMKSVVKAQEFGNFKPGELERIQTLPKLLEKLEHKNIIRVGDYRLLKQIMIKIDLVSVNEVIVDAERKLALQGQTVATIDYAEMAACPRPAMVMETDPPPSLNTNNSRKLTQKPSFDDAHPSDYHHVDMSTAQNIDDRPRYEDGRGYVLFINNFVEEAHDKRYLRVGSKIDEESMESLFDDCLLNYKLVLKEDLSKRKLQKTLKDTQKKLKEGDFARFMLILCSHGEQIVAKENDSLTEERILMVDGETISEEELTAPFLGDELKEFNAKPKVFMIQACRAPAPRQQDLSDDMTEDQPSYSGAGTAPRPPTLTHPVNANVLISYATSKGTKAWRNEDCGSWFIHHFCNVVRMRYKKEHLMDLLVRVNGEVARMESTQGGAKQMPCQVSTLTKHIWL